SLLNAGAALYVENHEKLTPCELGEILISKIKCFHSIFHF
ncbi:unnamed protein product, partial [Rotaria magnacalcarata]